MIFIQVAEQLANSQKQISNSNFNVFLCDILLRFGAWGLEFAQVEDLSAT